MVEVISHNAATAGIRSRNIHGMPAEAEAIKSRITTAPAPDKIIGEILLVKSGRDNNEFEKVIFIVSKLRH